MMRIEENRPQIPTGATYVLAARIEGELPAEPKAAEEDEKAEDKASGNGEEEEETPDTDADAKDAEEEAEANLN